MRPIAKISSMCVPCISMLTPCSVAESLQWCKELLAREATLHAEPQVTYNAMYSTTFMLMSQWYADDDNYHAHSHSL
jgi:hypothetical protein